MKACLHPRPYRVRHVTLLAEISPKVIRADYIGWFYAVLVSLCYKNTGEHTNELVFTFLLLLCCKGDVGAANGICLVKSYLFVE